MRDLIDLLARARELAVQGEPAVLATVVAVEGSAYRREGARLLVERDGRLTGVLSGGCLERDLAERAAAVFEHRAPTLAVYDLRAPDEALWGLGLGCGGKVTLLLEPLLPAEGADSPLAAHVRVAATRTPEALATVFATAGAANPLRVGDRFSDRPGLAPSGLDPRIHETLVAARGGARPFSTRIPVADGASDLLCEHLTPPPRLAIVGAGRDAVPLARLARELGWESVVADPRPTDAAAARFTGFATYVDGGPRTLVERLRIDAWTALVVMTHNYLDDLAALAELLPCASAYLGLLGPAARRDRLLSDLAMQGVTPAPADLARLHAPAGLDLGGRSPDEVALAIVAEIQDTFTGTSGRARDAREVSAVSRESAP